MPHIHAFASRLESFEHHGDDAWPLEATHSVTPAELARAGFYHSPIDGGQDNATCFLCHKSLGGWEEGDQALSEHLNHTIKKGNVKKACPFALLVSGGQKLLELGLKEGKDLVKLRKETFGKKGSGFWPHEGKRSWPTPDKLSNAGFHLEVAIANGDTVACCWCGLRLDSWAKNDVPADEHRRYAPQCHFFNQHVPYTGPMPLISKSVSDATIKAKPKIVIDSDEELTPILTATTSTRSAALSRSTRVADSDSETHDEQPPTQRSLMAASSISRSTRSTRLKSMASTVALDAPSLTPSISSQNVAAALIVTAAKPPSSKPTGMTQAMSASQVTPINLAPPKNLAQTAPIPATAEASHGILHVIAPLSAPVSKRSSKPKSSKETARPEPVPAVVEDSVVMEADDNLQATAEEELQYTTPEVEDVEMAAPFVPEKDTATETDYKTAAPVQQPPTSQNPASPIQTQSGDVSMEYVDASLASTTAALEAGQNVSPQMIQDVFSPNHTGKPQDVFSPGHLSKPAQVAPPASSPAHIIQSPAQATSVDPFLIRSPTPIASTPHHENSRIESEADEVMPMRTPVRVQNALPAGDIIDDPVRVTAISPSKMRTPLRPVLAQNVIHLPTSLPGYTDEELKMPVIDLYRRIVDEILSDTERHLRAKQADFRQKIEDGRRHIRDLGSELRQPAGHSTGEK